MWQNYSSDVYSRFDGTDQWQTLSERKRGGRSSQRDGFDLSELHQFSLSLENRIG
jgi:hypothetical protein